MKKAAVPFLFLFPVAWAWDYCVGQSPDCVEGNCQRSIPCYHGFCDSRGKCVCQPCYRGESCQVYEDRHGPTFYSPRDQAYVEDPWVATAVYRARAYDNDYGSVCAGRTSQCDCAQIFYSLLDDRDFFSIDNLTGEVFVREPLGLLSVGTHTVLIRAAGWRRQPEEPGGLMRVTFYTGQEVWTDPEWISSQAPPNQPAPVREKREVASPNHQTTSFQLSRVEGEEEKMEIGKTVCYNLAVSVPKTEGLDLVVEIFTKQINNNSYLPTFALCRVGVRPNPEISYSQHQPRIKMVLSQHVNTVYDRAVVDFGFLSSSADPGRVDVDFCVAQIRNADTTYQQKHLVTTGAEYDRENYVWVGQAEVVPNPVDQAADVPEIVTEVSGPSRLRLDSAGVFYLDAWISLRSSKVTVEIELNQTETVLTVGHLGVVQFGEYYVCVPQDIYYYNATYQGSERTCLNTRAKLEMGLMTNIGPLDKPVKDDGNKIRFTWAVYAPDLPANVGKEAEVTAAIWVGDEKLWSSVVSVQIEDRESEAGPKLHASHTEIYPAEDRRAAVGSLMSYLLLTRLDGVGGYFSQLVKVEVPKVDGQIQMEPCGARLLKAVDSFDVPYVPCHLDVEPEFDGDRTFLLRLNRIHVTDQRSPAKFNDSLVVTELIVKVATHSRSSAGSQLGMKVSVESSEGFQEVPVGRVHVVETKNQPVPAVRVENAASWELLHGGGAVAFRVAVAVSPAIGYGDLFFEAAGDEDSLLQICQIELARVGSHLPCLATHRDDVNRHITYGLLNSQSECVRSNRAAMKVGDVGAVDRPQTADSNAFVVKVVASLPSCSEYEDDTDYELTVGLTIGSRSMWASEVKYTSTVEPPTLPAEKKPTVQAELALESVAPGYAVELLLTIHTAPDSIGRHRITWRAEEEDSGVCILRVAAAGRNLPCVEFDTPAAYLPHARPDKGIREAELRFSALSNTGSPSSNQSRPENAIQLRATVKVSPEARRDQTLTWTVDYESGEESGQISLPVRPGSVPQMYGKDPKTANLSLTPGDQAAVGAPFFVTLDLELAEFFLAPVTVKIVNPDPSQHPYDVCLAGITDIGANYPCLAPTSVRTRIPSDRGPHRDSADIDLGTVCNSYIDRENFSANLIRLKVGLYLKPEVKPGQQLTVAVRMVVGNRTIGTLPPLTSTAVRHVPDVDPPERVRVEASRSDRIPIGVRQRMWVGYRIVVPPHSIVKISVKVKAPVKDRRAVFTLHRLRIASGGRNLPCPLAAGDVPYRLVSNLPTAQNDTIEADLGYFGNLGVSHVNGAEGDPDDDRLQIEALVELADHPDTRPGSVHAVDCLVTINGVDGKAQQWFVVERTGEEKPDLSAVVLVDDDRVYQSGDVVPMYASLEHSHLSLAEPDRVILRLYTPPYVVFDSETSWSPTKPTFDNRSGGLDIIFPLLTFPDRVRVNFTLLADPFKQRKHGKGVIAATTPYRILCAHTSRSPSGEDPAPERVFDCSRMSHLLYRINSAACHDKLGLDRPETIEDCQFTASSAASRDWAPHYARIPEEGKEHGRAWSPPVRSGPGQHYLQLDFLRRVRVGSVVLQRVPGLRYVTDFKLLYSQTGVDWILAIQAAADYREDLSTTELNMPVVGRFFRLLVLNNDRPSDLSRNVGVRLELFGCVVDKEIFVRCGPDGTWYTDDPKRVGRHLVLDTELDRIYFCDTRDDPGKKMCYSSDDGKSWNILPRNIGSLLGYDSDTRLVYAVDDRNWAYMATNDSRHWTLVKKTEMSNIRGRNSFASRLNIPSVTPKELGTVSAGRWKATVHSLNYEDSARVKWDLCCSG